jgi:Ca-activated chloride channel family protein
MALATLAVHAKRPTILMLPVVSLLLSVAPYAQKASPQRDAPSSASFHTAIDLVSLNVTVTDRANRFVLDLELPELSVFEDGVKQDVTFFTRERRSVALSLLLDSSTSMQDHLPALHAAATRLVRRLGSGDVAQIVDFDDRVYVRQPFTSNHALLETAIRQTLAGGATALYSAVYVALRELARVRATPEAVVRRQALIVFSDGEDTSSVVPSEQVLDVAKHSDTVVYGIVFRGSDKKSKRFREAEHVLRTLAQETGGRAFLYSGIENLGDIYAAIGEELASQYTIGYTSTNAKHDGAWRRVVVQVSRPHARARTRNGYYAVSRRR